MGKYYILAFITDSYNTDMVTFAVANKFLKLSIYNPNSSD